MGVLLMAMTVGGLIAAAILLVISLVTKKLWPAEIAFGGLVIWFGLYGSLLAGSSLTSSEKTLALNESKEYCGFYLDCHLSTTVTGVRRARAIGGLTANGEFTIVTVQVSNSAVRASLALHGVDAHVVDANGAEYTRDMNAESQLPPQPEFERSIGPKGSFEKQIVFDLPADVQKPRLDVREGLGIDSIFEAFLIGDEDSMFHKRTYFDISEQIAAAGVK